MECCESCTGYLISFHLNWTFSKLVYYREYFQKLILINWGSLENQRRENNNALILLTSFKINESFMVTFL